MKKSCMLAVDLGGTNLRIGLVDREGHVILRRRAKMPEVYDKDSLYRRLAAKITRFLLSCGPSATPDGVAIGFAGPTKSSAGYVYCTPNVGQLEDLNVGANLERLLRMPVFIANDANCAAVGESWVGAGKNAKSLFLFTLGTGVGGSLVTESGVWEGEYGIAGEIGHTVIAMNGPRCRCGRRGCLETLVSATAIVRDYAKLMKRSSVKDRDSLSAKLVFDRARRGDHVAMRVVDNVATALGIGIANVFNLLNPELILLGGGVSRAGRILIDPAVRHARDMVFPPLKQQLQVSRASLGDDAGLIGAARLAFKHLQ